MHEPLIKHIPKEALEKLPISFSYLKAFSHKNSIQLDMYVRIDQFQSLKCLVYKSPKPISKML
jgi:hypothetical protein